MTNLEKLIKEREDLTSFFHRKQLIIDESIKKGYELGYTEEEIIDLNTHHLNEKWYQKELDKINPKIEPALMSLEDKLEYRETEITSSTPEIPEVFVQEAIIPKEIPKLKINEELTANYLQKLIKIEEDFNLENSPIPDFSLDNHIGYVKNLSVKVGVVAGSYVVNTALTSMGLPPVTGLKYIAIGGIKIAGVTASAAINYCAANPVTATAIATNSPIVFKYVQQGVQKLTEKKEDPTPVVDTTTVQDPYIDTLIKAGQPKVEYNSVWDFFEVIGSITWKVLKKIESLLS